MTLGSKGNPYALIQILVGFEEFTGTGTKRFPSSRAQRHI